jgi:hypothetical protein
VDDAISVIAIIAKLAGQLQRGAPLLVVASMELDSLDSSS